MQPRQPVFCRTAIFAAATCAVAAVSVAPTPAKAEALLVIEADTGKVLHADQATTPWYPASITKIMTAYVALRAVKEGRMTLESVLKVSVNAAAAPPTKMGFPPGTVVTLDNALKMLMVKSANDIAVAIAEGVGGSVEGFSDLMNAQARRIGMTQSNFVNPHGLPADQQITSARDMAMLARTVLREFPEYNYFWSLPGIRLGKRIYRNHNNLMGRYEGTDGMKTGFICASGFNVVATATRGGKRLIAVVLGSPSPAVRAVKAAQLFERGFSVRPLSWLTPGMGQVDALTPTNLDPPNLRDSVCGKGRRRPPSEEAENDPLADVAADSPYAVFLSTLRGTGKDQNGKLLTDVRLGEPVRVYTGPPSAPVDQAPAEAKAKGKGKTKVAKGKKSGEGKATAKAADGPALAHSSTSSPVTTDAGSAPEGKKKAAKKAAPKEATAKKEGAKKDAAKKDATAKADTKAKAKTPAKKTETTKQ
jgi:D-alanyl-D-alanine carboxypeptidase